ncbi:hypothetical protein ASG29_09015 [Sphingomonas sp. Leaf412]|uniref:hypothetical protein n=1 Tax=Sphingomonas sp. Leaf412 TaxID=1736370 RepID=UPI0006F349E7|nr:hypothetical protein [Sphingomonas sp. Leaf412]KQT31993.1 hypothetical protein ASG29_09015 [Sphingomonas sp. Leaf412]
MSKKAKRIPKTIAGVKVPKELRKAGERLLDEVQRPENQAKIAGVLTMAAGAVAAAAAKKRAGAAPEDVRRPGEGGTREGGAKGFDGQQVADALGQAAEQALGRIFGKR